MGVYYSKDITNVLVPQVTKSTSRYKTKLRLSNIDRTTKIRFIRKRDLDFDDTDSVIHFVGYQEQFRPDLISAQYYNSEKYSWVILAANNLKTPYEMKAGMRLVIPSLVTLQGYNGKLVTK